MAKLRTNDADAGQLSLFALAEVQFVPTGDGNFRTVQVKPVVMASVRQAAKITGESRKVIYNLYHAGIVAGEQRTPRKIMIDMESLRRHLRGTRDPEYWNADKRTAYDGARNRQKLQN